MQEHDPQRTPAGEESRRLTKGEIRWIIGGILAILFGIFIAQNAREVQIDFVFFSAKFRLIWLFLICALIGALIDRLLQRRGLLPPTPRRKRKSADERRRAGGQ
jgi:uncharacterized integral membrane protein